VPPFPQGVSLNRVDLGIVRWNESKPPFADFSPFGGMLIEAAGGTGAMATEEDREPLSTEVSPLDLQLSACAIEGHQDGPTQAGERLPRVTGLAQAGSSSNTVRLAVGQLQASLAALCGLSFL